MATLGGHDGIHPTTPAAILGSLPNFFASSHSFPQKIEEHQFQRAIRLDLESAHPEFIAYRLHTTHMLLELPAILDAGGGGIDIQFASILHIVKNRLLRKIECHLDRIEKMKKDDIMPAGAERR